MASVEFEKVLKKTVGPGKIRESLVGSRKFVKCAIVLVLVSVTVSLHGIRFGFHVNKMF